MAGNLELKTGSVTHLQNNTSGALANGAAVQLATADFDNSTGLGFSATARMTTNGFGATTGIVGTTVDLYLVPFTDGTNPSTVDTATPEMPPGAYRNSFVIDTTGAAQYLDIEGIALGPYKYRGYIVNNTGQTLSAGWLVDIYSELEQYT